VAKTALTLIADSGFWIALFDDKDGRHAEATEKARYLDLCQVFCPWPILYETLRTKLVRNAAATRRYEEFLNQSKASFLNDVTYRENALAEVFRNARANRRQVSLADMVIRYILADVKIKSDYFLTFDPEHFVDVCHARRIEMLL
jgi:predicted nucleic acid-binding protein